MKQSEIEASFTHSFNTGLLTMPYGSGCFFLLTDAAFAIDKYFDGATLLSSSIATTVPVSATDFINQLKSTYTVEKFTDIDDPKLINCSYFSDYKPSIKGKNIIITDLKLSRHWVFGKTKVETDTSDTLNTEVGEPVILPETWGEVKPITGSILRSNDENTNIDRLVDILAKLSTLDKKIKSSDASDGHKNLAIRILKNAIAPINTEILNGVDLELVNVTIESLGE